MATTIHLYKSRPALHNNMADCSCPLSKIYIFGSLFQKSHNFQWRQSWDTCSHRSRRLAQIGYREWKTWTRIHLSHRCRTSKFFHCWSFCVHPPIRASILRKHRWIRTCRKTMAHPDRVPGWSESQGWAFLQTTSKLDCFRTTTTTTTTGTQNELLFWKCGNHSDSNTGVTCQNIPPAGSYPGLKRPRLDYTRVYYGLGQFIPRGILWPRPIHIPSGQNISSWYRPRYQYCWVIYSWFISFFNKLLMIQFCHVS